jgi:NAD-dependent dihydropyrimidine dehydrogenase PreA subunit
MLRFSKEIADQPITSQVILEQNVPVKAVVKAFRSKGVTVDVRKLVEKDDDKCVDCGACVSLCPMDALTFGEGHAVILDEERCNGITCGLCVDACTMRAIRLLG